MFIFLTGGPEVFFVSFESYFLILKIITKRSSYPSGKISHFSQYRDKRRDQIFKQYNSSNYYLFLL